ncbi:hypothetical protein [Streptomyces dysideae]|uniref:Uncharacterized protein n=1 Tax=Streptomyces dysideae TaxID=909626 RepID=A0A101UZ41_9ACTN|nr:hypothetical protein [Streptomyces dysideae]KUO19471.1 hypothetical protein AQJ91_19090 [Streptomyces dysideae]
MHLSATAAKAVYTFDYMRDGRRIDFLNRAVRRAELDHPEMTGEFELYFHALDDAFGLQLPRQDIQETLSRNPGGLGLPPSPPRRLHTGAGPVSRRQRCSVSRPGR